MPKSSNAGAFTVLKFKKITRSRFYITHGDEKPLINLIQNYIKNINRYIIQNGAYIDSCYTNGINILIREDKRCAYAIQLKFFSNKIQGVYKIV